MTASPIVRFAPSPTGRLHVGNIRTALFNWLHAKPDGTFILRLDDTDAERSTQAFADGIVEDLVWLGVVPDRTERQSDRFALYEKAANTLEAAGLLYRCYETPEELDRNRKRLLGRGKPPVYDRAALKLTNEDHARLQADGREPHWRFLLPNHDGDPFNTKRTDVTFEDLYRGTQIVDLASMSDPVLRRADGTWLYTLPSVVDDLDMGVTHVIRGGDHVANTGVQIALMRALGASEMPTFGHHNLLTDADGEGLSKRKGSAAISQLRANGFEPMAVAAMTVLTGTDRDIIAAVDMNELGEHFAGASVSKGAARFSDAELAAVNERVLHAMPYERALARLDEFDADLGEAFWTLVRDNLRHFGDVTRWRDIVGGEIESAADAEDKDFLDSAKALLPDEPWGDTAWADWTAALKGETGRKGRGLFMPLRKALTGLDHGPDMGGLLPLIGRERTLRRLP